MQFNIGDFLKKFKTFVPRGKVIIDELVQVVHEETGVLLQREAVSFRNNVAFINTTPAIKNELFMRKHRILLKIHERTGDKSLKDMR